MSSSSNRPDVLEGSSSRSEEQKRTLDAGSNKSDDVEGDLSRAAIVDDEIEMKALDANIARIARLEAMLKIQQEESASRIGELEQKVTDLEVEQRLAAGRPAPQPTVPTGSSDPTLRAEISRLEQEVAAKDAIIVRRNRTIELHDACFDGLMGDIRYTREVAAQNDNQPPAAPTPAMVPAGAAPAPQETIERDNLQEFQTVRTVKEESAERDRVRPDIASDVTDEEGVIFDNEGYEWDAHLIKFTLRVDGPIPPEVVTAYQRGALRVPKTEVSSAHDPWGAVGHASRPNARKRSIDEEQPGTSPPTKRLRGT